MINNGMLILGLEYSQQQTGSWFAHSKDDKLWLDRLLIRKADGELTTPAAHTAADYAARQHIAQRRKGERAEPYINHLTEVAALLAEATDGDDVVLLMGGLLHDTLEDTDSTYEDLVERFGSDVAALVAEVTDDKSLPKEERKRLQIAKTAGKSRRA